MNFKFIIINFYQYLVRKISQKFTKKRKILLYCGSPTMEDHLLEYYNNFIGADSIQFWLYYPNSIYPSEFINKFKNQPIKYIHSKFQLYINNYDLIVNPDLYSTLTFNGKSIPMMYINHGLHMVSYDNGETLYAYDKGCKNEKNIPIFSTMFEPNKRIRNIVIKQDTTLSKIVKYTGYKFADDILRESKNKELYRENLGIDKDITVVFVLGTWNKESLFHMLGDDLFRYAQKLKEKKYQFIFSIHPKEYSKYAEDIDPKGKLVEQQREKGFIVRSPKEDWLPYMMASDIIFCDYSSMAEIAMIADKKIIFSDFPQNKVWKYSTISQAKRILPTISHLDELEDVLDSVKNSPLSPEIGKFKAEIINEPGKYKKTIIEETLKLLNLKEIE